MASKAIQTVRAGVLDASLYDDLSTSALPRISRGAILTALSRAFDLAEGRRPGHAQRVAYVGVALAEELGLTGTRLEEVFFGCLLHDVGMAATPPVVRDGPVAQRPGTRDRLAAVPQGGWADVIEALTLHCDQGANVARRLGLGESVARAVASHHDCWDGSGLGATPGDKQPLVARIVAVADRVESMIDAEGSPLIVRRRGPRLVREMGGTEIDPELAERMAMLAARDEFWLGFYDNDLATGLMSLNYGGVMGREELFDFLGVMSDVVDGRNGREPGRGRRVAELAQRVALACDMPERRADLVKIAALLQDLGTLGVPAHVLSKPDILTIEEMGTVQMHPTYARDILSEVPGLGAPAWWVGCHHERVDGKGYPGMLEGDEVPVEAQVIGMCEAFDALTSDRPYRKAMSRADAVEVLRGLSGTRFDERVLESFEAAEGPFTTP